MTSIPTPMPMFAASALDQPVALPDPLLHLRDVGKHIESKAGRINLLNHINLSISPGDFVSIMGPSGAGKTTLLNILAMFDSDFTGEFTFAGRGVHRLKPKERRELNKRHIGFDFQQYHLLDDLTVYLRSDGQEVRYLPVAAAVRRPAPVAGVLLLDRKSGGAAQIAAVPPLEVLTTLLGSAYSTRGAMAAETLQALAATVNAARLGRLSYAALDEAVGAVDGFFR